MFRGDWRIHPYQDWRDRPDGGADRAHERLADAVVRRAHLHSPQNHGNGDAAGLESCFSRRTRRLHAGQPPAVGILPVLLSNDAPTSSCWRGSPLSGISARNGCQSRTTHLSATRAISQRRTVAKASEVFSLGWPDVNSSVSVVAQASADEEYATSILDLSG